jgi:hypothetical protein
MSSPKDFPPREPISVRSLPTALKALNDAREARIGSASTAFGAEQEEARLAILALCHRLIGRTRAAPPSGLRDDALALATETREFMTNIGSPARRTMREAVERMNKQQRDTSK